MRSSSLGGAGLVAAVGLLAAMLSGGCAHAPSERPAAPQPPAAPPVSPGRSERRPAPRATTEPPGKPDPSEEITPAELATIPDPVPAAGATQRPSTPPGDSAEEVGPHTTRSESVAPAPSTALWRVQVYASEDRDEAERVGRSAAARLGTDYVIEREGDVYKVRLGAFASEEDAGALRDRAVRAGYPGAFRTLVHP